MALYRTRNRLFLFKIEAVSGVAETPTVADNAILVEEPLPVPNFEIIQTNEAGGSLDGRGPIVGGGNFAMTGRFYVKGAGTAGAAPEYGHLLRACALSETLTAADVIGTAQAGSASTITLHVGASAVSDAYKGMVIETTGGIGNGQTRVISAYDGATKVATVVPNWTTNPDATTTFAIRANALYGPVSTGLETGTGWLYDLAASAATNSLLRQIVGSAGNLQLEGTVRGLLRATYRLQGILPDNPANVAPPGTPSFDATRPRPILLADAFLGGSTVKFRTFSLDLGNTVQQADDPAARYGYDVAGVTSRRMTGSINPLLGLLSARNSFADFTAGTPRSLWLRYGNIPGNRISLFVPEAVYTGAEPSDIDGFNAENLAFECAGFDSGVFICVY